MSLKPQHIFVRHDGRFTKIVFADILYIESVKNFIRLHFEKHELMILISLRQMERELPDTFCRVHRSFIVNTSHMQSFDHEQVWFGKKWVPIALQFRDVLPKKVNIVLSETRSFSGMSKMEIRNLLN
ncbi:MAG: LytTR family DNA-binding domain-containing protein [Bacteroidota bacterium]